MTRLPRRVATGITMTALTIAALAAIPVATAAAPSALATAAASQTFVGIAAGHNAWLTAQIRALNKANLAGYSESQCTLSETGDQDFARAKYTCVS